MFSDAVVTGYIQGAVAIEYFIRCSYYVDDVLVMTVDPVTNFWDFGGLTGGYDNPWVAGEKMAPFDQKVRLFVCLYS